MADERSTEATTATAASETICPDCQSPRPDLTRTCPHCGAPPVEGATPPPRTAGEHRRSASDSLFAVRASDIEPYVGLRYLSKLFRLMAVILVLLLVAEIITGFLSQGTAALPTLLGESSKLIVAAGLLWGSGDLAHLLIDIGHDVRATRILLGRQAAHQLGAQQQDQRRGPEEREPR
jgi:hypothetical protein